MLQILLVSNIELPLTNAKRLSLGIGFKKEKLRKVI